MATLMQPHESFRIFTGVTSSRFGQRN